MSHAAAQPPKAAAKPGRKPKAAPVASMCLRKPPQHPAVTTDDAYIRCTLLVLTPCDNLRSTEGKLCGCLHCRL